MYCIPESLTFLFDLLLVDRVFLSDECSQQGIKSKFQNIASLARSHSQCH